MPELHCPKFYLTTAIAYTSKKPHIGNTYEAVLSDAIVRFKRMMGYDTYFLTGTDEHGQKIEQMAQEAGVSPQAYVDQVAGEIRTVWDLMHTSYDQFIRTTDPVHVKTVQAMFQKLYDQGDIYKGHYEGLYCTPCESFWTESQLIDGCCPDCRRAVTLTQEEAYFFRMSNYQDRLTQHLEEHPDFILPESRKREMIGNFLTPGLQDLCVSRTSFSWGIPVSFDPDHVVYVWLDALTNYITALGYHPDQPSDETFTHYWPCDLHVIGKDILRFHTIYWPIILMALDLPLPKQILGHPWLLAGADQDKMSKSRGNVLYADELIDLVGVDGLRYFLLKEMPYATDGTITQALLVERYNSDLANTLGNLVNRTVSMTHQYFAGAVENPGVTDPLDAELSEAVSLAREQYLDWMGRYRLSDAIEVVMELSRRLNKYIDQTTPWLLAKQTDDHPRLQTVLYHLLEGIREVALLLYPIISETSRNIYAQIGLPRDQGDEKGSALPPETFLTAAPFGTREAGMVASPSPLFMRLKVEKPAPAPSKPAKPTASAEPAATPPADQSQITIDDFGKLSLVAAKVLSCEPVKKSDKLLCLQLDDGSGTPRQVVSGIAAWYEPADLVGNMVIIVANLKPAKLRGVVSQGMILAADLPRQDDGADTQAGVVFLPDNVPPGAVIR